MKNFKTEEIKIFKNQIHILFKNIVLIVNKWIYEDQTSIKPINIHVYHGQVLLHVWRRNQTNTEKVHIFTNNVKSATK